MGTRSDHRGCLAREAPGRIGPDVPTFAVDETMPGLFEWHVRRLATSFEQARRDRDRIEIRGDRQPVEGVQP
jgi:hypothetical protein